MYALAGFLVLVSGGVLYIKAAFPKVGPPQQLTVESTSERIERGKYLAHHVALCIDCHSERNYDLYTAPPKAGTEGQGDEAFDENMGFPGNIYSKNITPSAIGEWSDGELFRAITSGVRKNGEPLFPIMPYPNYAQLDPEDIYSIMTYIRTLAPIEHKVRETTLRVPMNLIVRTIPRDPQMGKRPDRSDSVAYGQYLTTMASCSDCHTPSEKGEPLPGMKFAGGMTFLTPWGTLHTANITPDEATGIGKWSKEQFIRKFKAYADSSILIPIKPPYDETRYQTIMPWSQYAGMTEDDLGAIFTYLRTVKPVSHKVTKYSPEGAIYTP